MRLYISNVTSQRRVVFYRLDFVNEGNPAARANNLKNITIDAGKQITIGGDLTPEQAQMIMDQLAIYGAVGVEEINRLPRVKIPYVLSFGKEIPMRIIRMVDEHNKNLLTNEGNKRREQAAIAAHPLVDQQIDNLKRFDVEMLEVPPEPGDPEPVGKPLDFGAHIDPNAREAQGRQLRPNGKRHRRR